MATHIPKGNGSITVKGNNGRIVGNLPSAATNGPQDSATISGVWGKEFKSWTGNDWECPKCDSVAEPFEDTNKCLTCVLESSDEENAPKNNEYDATNLERRKQIADEIHTKPKMNYKYAYCPDCGKAVSVTATPTKTFSVPHEGCPYGHLYREAEFDHTRMCAEIIIGEDEGAPLNGYIALWRGNRAEIYAETSYDAQKEATAIFQRTTRSKVRDYEVTVVLAEKNGETVSHSTSAF